MKASSAVSISDAFDGGNIEHVKNEDGSVFLKVKPDPYTELEKTNHMQYFSFRSRVYAEDKVNMKYIIENAGECSYPSGWPGYTVFYSTDRTTWRRVLDTNYDAEKGHLEWSFDHNNASNGESVHFCYYPPYSYERHLDLIAQCELANGATVKSLGQTLDGREMECITCGDGPLSAWIIHRQHPGENMAEFFAEGLLTRLLGLDTDGAVDGLAKKALSLFTFHIVPNMNPDGALRGHLRTNACGANLNREWCSTGDYVAPTLDRSPEVYHVLRAMDKTGVDIFADVHGDEALPFNFIAGAEGCPNWSERLKALQSSVLGAYCRANSDMQKAIGYEPEEPGNARMAVCSNQIAVRFDCLAFTLEMPFKDCLSYPDPERGWHPSRAAQLGASLLDSFVYVQPNLRSNEVFWSSLPEDDTYVRPTEKYL
eukprot:CAMPEP_0116066360 /NCGR_PEP_ID=MMETSP0322-20121206/10329_1 /TAXON_ID=163516 /ORGANISM="Leptocylindrus danicus var. apora, Strain B651" /LENGTH=425 /DNA_ID=CAMNT_0003552885 /DNA_START=295 /DNA_END=1572 /DNA_ORIENTATION=+